MTKIRTNPDMILYVLMPYICLLFFLFVQASVSLRLILELLNMVPGAFYGLTGALMVFSGTVCLLIQVLQRISRLIDGTVTDSIWKQRMAAGSIVCFGLIYPAAMGFRDGMTALFYYKAVNLQILLPWVVMGVIQNMHNNNIGKKGL